MKRARARRRRLALATLAVLAVAGFAIGAVVGGNSGGGRPTARWAGQGSTALRATAAGGCVPGESASADEEARPTLAERLSPSELAGERIVVSLDGTGLTPELRQAIHSGKVAGVVLFEADFPTRAA